MRPKRFRSGSSTASSRPLEVVDDFIERAVRERGTAMDRTGEFDRGLLEEASELGLTRIFWTPDLDLDLSSMPFAHESTERIAAVCTPLAMEIGVTRLVAYLLSRYARPRPCCCSCSRSAWTTSSCSTP